MWTRVIPELSRALRDPAGWESMYITYAEPFVERLWRPYGDGRISIHRLLPCRQGKPLEHPHPWPSWVGILDGGEGDYEHGVGWHDGEQFRLAAKHFLSTGDQYSMKDREAWHYVNPHAPVLSVMVTNPPWDNPVPFPTPPKQGKLSDAQKDQLIEDARTALWM